LGPIRAKLDLAPLDVTRDELIDHLIEESRDAGSKISAHLVAMEQTTVVAFGAVFIGASLVIDKGKTFILMGLPLVGTLFLTHAFDLLGEVFSLGGYRAALEEAIEEQAGFPVGIWESQISPHVRHVAWPWKAMTTSFPFWATVGAFITAVDATAIYEAFHTRHHNAWGHSYSALLIVGTLLIVILGALAIVAGLIAVSIEGKKAYELASTKYRASLPGRDEAMRCRLHRSS
jgi:hypothetical protein